jgi:hypothetical protein
MLVKLTPGLPGPRVVAAGLRALKRAGLTLPIAEVGQTPVTK